MRIAIDEQVCQQIIATGIVIVQRRGAHPHLSSNPTQRKRGRPLLCHLLAGNLLDLLTCLLMSAFSPAQSHGIPSAWATESALYHCQAANVSRRVRAVSSLGVALIPLS